MKTFQILLLATAGMPLTPAMAVDANAALTTAAPAHTAPTVLTPAQRDGYRAIFAAIDDRDWSSAAAQIDAIGDGPLTAAARAELYLAKGSPVVTLDQIQTLLAAAPELPQADQLGRLALKRGATTIPVLPTPQTLIWQGSQPRRTRLASASDPASIQLNAIVQPLVVADQPADAEQALIKVQSELPPEALAEYQQRIAWSFYLNGRDQDARRLADAARSGVGEWTLQAAWTSGLAAWRMKDCAAASDAFATVGGRSTDPELAAAGLYWAARADMMCGKPERAIAASHRRADEGDLLRAACRDPARYHREQLLRPAQFPRRRMAIDRRQDQRQGGDRLEGNR